MPTPPETMDTSGQQDWVDDSGKPHRLDGPSSIQFGERNRSIVSWANAGKSHQFVLYDAESYYFAKLDEHGWSHKRKGPTS